MLNTVNTIFFAFISQCLTRNESCPLTMQQALSWPYNLSASLSHCHKSPAILRLSKICNTTGFYPLFEMCCIIPSYPTICMPSDCILFIIITLVHGGTAWGCSHWFVCLTMTTTFDSYRCGFKIDVPNIENKKSN